MEPYTKAQGCKKGLAIVAFSLLRNNMQLEVRVNNFAPPFTPSIHLSPFFSPGEAKVFYCTFNDERSPLSFHFVVLAISQTLDKENAVRLRAAIIRVFAFNNLTSRQLGKKILFVLGIFR